MLFSRVNKIASVLIATTLLTTSALTADDSMPISDAHLHYSHDSVELTPPARVIEIMRSANLKIALVSSSDDNGTQLLSELAPDLIVPGLRPYRRRGELNTWFTDEGALQYVEKLLAANRYATIGEFHLYGSDADLDIPRRIVELAAEHNLILHAHSDADAVERLLAQDPTVKVLWAHAGFDSPEEVSKMLDKHDRLWADLAFRSEVGSGGELSEEWTALFTKHPDRMMLGTDTYTPERIYFIPSHADNAREWLKSLPADLAEKVAWKNAYDLLMPHWQSNREVAAADKDADACAIAADSDAYRVSESPIVLIEPTEAMTVSEQFSVDVKVCAKDLADATLTLDAMMVAHGHGMNYTPEYKVLEQSDNTLTVRVEGLVLHMPGNWQWSVEMQSGGNKSVYKHDFAIQ